jgi:3-methyladenine DNA glycosylase AlkD
MSPADVTAGDVVERLAAAADPQFRIDMPTKYGIHTDQAFGVRMATVRTIAKGLGTNHALALDLWDTGWYEARIVASIIDDPALVTPEQMDRWCADFDNWAVVDTVCFNLFDRTAHAWTKVDEWAASDAEFVRRASFALLWTLANHDRASPDRHFVARLPLLEVGATDVRPLVHKAVIMALGAMAKRRPTLVDPVSAVAARLAAADGTRRKVGRAVQREIAKVRR